MIKIKFILLVSMFFTLTFSNTLPVDENILSGELPNGFKYTILKNDKPKDKVELRLIVAAGSLEEDEDQKGIAHLVEHLAFNGSEHFKENELVEFLESIGVSFGLHLNASTSYDMTIYKLSVPLKKDNFLKAMTVFQDWAGGVYFQKKSLDKERGVVVEEARVRNNAGFRIWEKFKDIVFDGTKYKDRTPIGDMNIVKNISLKRVKDFYDDWYRPEFMNFVAVGDFEPKEVEKLIKKTFSHLKNKSTRKRASRSIKDINETRFIFLQDKELVGSSLTIDFLTPNESIRTEENLRKLIIQTLMIQMFNQRATKKILEKNPAAKSISFINSKLGDNLQGFSFYASYTGKKEIQALNELIRFMYTIEKFGFSKQEFQRASERMKKTSLEGLKKLNNQDSSILINSILDDIIDNNTIINEKYNLEFTLQVLENIKLEEINKMYKNILSSKNRIISYRTSNDVSLSKEKVLKNLENAKKEIKKEQKDKNLPKKISKDLKIGKIVSKKYFKNFDYYEYILENGVKVVYKFNDYDKNFVELSSFSDGGFSLLDTKDIINAEFASSIISHSGFDQYNFLEVDNIYSDKTVQVSPYISRYKEGLKASSSSEDFEFLLERIYLLATKYKCDENLLNNSKNITKSNLKKIENNPEMKFHREFSDFLYDNNKRFKQMTIEDIDTLNKEKMLEIYKNRFSDFNNFNFVVVGDINQSSVEKYIALYLANLPVLDRNESYNFRGIKPKSTNLQFIKDYSNENISKVNFKMSKEISLSREEDIALNILEDILKTKLRESLREEKSGTYGVSVGINFQKKPYELVTTFIGYSCEPERKDELKKYVLEAIKDIKENKVEQKYIESSIKKEKVSLKEYEKTNNFLLNSLEDYYEFGYELNVSNEYNEVYKKINQDIIKKLANKILDEKNIVYSELNPKKK